MFTLRTDWEILEYSCEENNKGLIEGRIKVPNYDKSSSRSLKHPKLTSRPPFLPASGGAGDFR